MISSILSMYKALVGGSREKTDISTYGAIGILLLGLTGFLWAGWQAMTSSVIKLEKWVIQRPGAAPLFPSVTEEQALAGLYGSVAPPPVTDTDKRFYIHEPIDDDALLLAAPRAQLAASLVGVLISSKPENTLAIIESAGKQVSYVPGDRIAGKFTILRILPDRVVINQNGFYAALILAE